MLRSIDTWIYRPACHFGIGFGKFKQKKNLSRTLIAKPSLLQQKKFLNTTVWTLFMGLFFNQLFPKQLARRSEEHTSELQSREKLVCRLLLEKKKKKKDNKGGTYNVARWHYENN